MKSSTTNLLIAACIFILVAVGAYFLISKKTDAPKTPAQPGGAGTGTDTPNAKANKPSKKDLAAQPDPEDVANYLMGQQKLSAAGAAVNALNQQATFPAGQVPNTLPGLF